MPQLKVMISGGGTGGHIFPAIAIANAVKERVPDARFLFVGAEGKMEMEKVPAAGYEIAGLPIRGFQRKALWKNIGLPWRLLRSMWKARRIVRTFKPQVAVGVGGYASGPVIAAAQRAGVPTLIQEQNSHAGATNRMLAKRASIICVAYSGMDRFFPKEKIRLTGNPVRQDMVRLAGKRPRGFEHFNLQDGAPVVFVTGGSLGARGINLGVMAALEQLRDRGVQLIWQTGTPFLAEAEAAVQRAAYTGARVQAFINRMDLAYAIADVVVARAGAISVSELCLNQLPSILVPLPTAAEDHQTSNARALADIGAAVLVKDAGAVEHLGPALLRLVADPVERQRLREAMATLGMGNAAAAIAAEVLRIALPATDDDNSNA
ncbi:MAG TPA: undecaprenyldiphospho-muramoylpentapeptide beta-N-acetylglucosaminyltransferase [Flavobacteriales bacterium]|nr:undecaprenyldiphospho-muramoylpentapeptide beta-N-acetylglucosaminyltransferase [Flavobacteriales bacterium]HRP80802.1 undecaprenyldiphospho-muramoylpentapeptide beta-N-acetylglucosaminyltransferase [Flavobacteriales bacterium]HRQ85724.1 undecaprenyldiphospho-muramoylpentapeptide beta-N-acetylglucosaminyltransferase [Flavobacteriales bacterium]